MEFQGKTVVRRLSCTRALVQTASSTVAPASGKYICVRGDTTCKSTALVHSMIPKQRNFVSSVQETSAPGEAKATTGQNWLVSGIKRTMIKESFRVENSE